MVKSLKEFAVSVVETLKAAGFNAAFAGGCVRDFLLGKEPKDFDICTIARPEEVEALFTHTIPVGKQFGVIIVMNEEQTFKVEVATLRGDGDYKDGRRPETVFFVDEFREDAARRDFTINAMFMDPTTGEIFDYFDGAKDLEKRIIRSVGNASDRISEDKLRMLRAVRFAAKLGFVIESDLMGAIVDNRRAINQVSAERIRKEIEEILISANPLFGLDLLMTTGLMQEILPEICLLDTESGMQDGCYHPEGTTWQHTRLVIEQLQLQGAGFILMFGGLLHDVGKPATQQILDNGRITNHKHAEIGAEIGKAICSRFKLSSEESFRVCELIRLHMRLHFVKEMRPGKLAEFIERPDFNDLIALQHADVMGTARLDRVESSHKEFLLAKLGEMKEIISEAPLVDGDLLIEWGFEPGPKIRVIKIEALRAQREDQFKDVQNARKWVMNIFKDWDGRFPIPNLEKGGTV